MLLTVSKPGEKADVPVGVIVGSVIAGLLLLALAVGLLWKVRACLCFIEQCRFACFSFRKETSTRFLFLVRLLQEEVPAASAGGGGRRRRRSAVNQERRRAAGLFAIVSLARVKCTSDPSLEVLNERRRFTLWITWNPGFFRLSLLSSVDHSDYLLFMH